jgi:hypothetical protein
MIQGLIRTRLIIRIRVMEVVGRASRLRSGWQWPRTTSPIGIGARLPRRTRTKPREWWKVSNAQLDDEVDDDIEDAEMGYEIALSTVSNAKSLSYAEALRPPDAEQWKHAALEELNAHSTMGLGNLSLNLLGRR